MVDTHLVDKVRDLDAADLSMFLCGGGGEIGYDLLLPLHELLALNEVSLAPLADQSPMKRRAIETRIVKALKAKQSMEPSTPPSVSQFRRAAMAEDSQSLSVMISHIKNEVLVREMIDLPSAEGGKTALHLAAWRGNVANVQLLLDYNANIDQVSTGKGNYGKSAIFYAITRCRDEVVTILLERGASVSIVNNKGQTPRSLAVSHLQELTQERIRMKELTDLSKWLNYRETHSDHITYGDLDSRFIDEYVESTSGERIPVDRSGPFECIMPSSFESRWRGNFTFLSRNRRSLRGSAHTEKSKNEYNLAVCAHDIPCSCRSDEYVYGPLPPNDLYSEMIVEIESTHDKTLGTKKVENESDFLSMDDLSDFMHSRDHELMKPIVVCDKQTLSKFKQAMETLLLMADSESVKDLPPLLGIDCEWKPGESGNRHFNRVSAPVLL